MSRILAEHPRICSLQSAIWDYKTAMIGKIGSDMHGSFLKKTLEQEGICTDYIVEDGTVFTTLAFVAINENGERRFSFAREPGADTCLSASELNCQVIRDCKIFHFGSLSLTDEPARTATIEAVKTAKAAGALISFDPNYRALDGVRSWRLLH